MLDRSDKELPYTLAELDASLLDGLWVWDLSAGRCWCSARLMQQCGLEGAPRWLAGEAWHAWIEPEDRAQVGRFWDSLLHSADLHDGCLAALAVPGGIRWTARIHGRVVERDAAGRPLRLLGFFRDGGAERAAHATTERQTHLLDLALRKTPMVVQIFSQSGLIYISPNCVDLFGLTPTEMAGVADFAFVHPDDREASRAGIARSLAQPGAVFSDECRILRKDGSSHWVQVVGCFYREGPLAGCFVSCINTIHDRKLLEDEVRRHRDRLEELVAERTRELEQANVQLREEIAQHQRAQALLRERESQLIRAGKLSALGTLVAGVAHEVQTPAATIAAGLDLLAGGALPAHEQQAQFERMRRAGSHIIEVVENLKNFARDQAFSSMETVSAAELAEGALALVRDLARRHRATLSVTVSPDLPPLFASRRRMIQVLVNVLINACQALRPEGGQVVLSVLPVADGIEFRIEDDGIGIPDGLRERLCEPFFTTKAERGGLGLGLAVSFEILREHGGDIQFAPRPAAGTVVAIRLPWGPKPCR